MKTNITTFALIAIITSSAFAALKAPMPEFKNDKQLAEWRAGKASQATSQGYAKDEPAFYTGKPYLASSGNYAFKYRSYDPEIARWTSEDPSGFPDGANSNVYVTCPTTYIDYSGLWRVSLVQGSSANSPGNDVTPGGRVFYDATQAVNSASFGISNEIKVGMWGSWIRSEIAGSVSVSPGGKEILLSWRSGTNQIKPGFTGSSGVGAANITYSDENKTVSFNFTYAGNSNLSGLSAGPAGVSSNSNGFAYGFGTIIYTLVE